VPGRSFLSDIQDSSSEPRKRNGLGGAFEQELFALGITSKDSRTYRPQTCVTVECFQQTVKKFLAAQDGVTKKQLQRVLDGFIA
jgi:hypothetical protein